MSTHKVVVDLISKTSGDGFKKAGAEAQGLESKVTSASTAMVKVGGAAVIGGAAVGVALYKAAQQASGLSESINKSNVVFGKNGAEVTKWAGTLAEKFGLSQREALAAATSFGSMFRTTGLGADAAAKMSQKMTELAGDMASFNDADPSDMLLRLQSGLAGEAEPLRKFGVLLSEARVQTYAYNHGIAEQGAKLTEAQKVQARYGLILKDTKLQQGDFARTAGSAANAMRSLKAEWDNLTTNIGSGALPVLQKVLGVLKGVAGGLSGINDATGGAAGGIATFGAAAAVLVGGTLVLIGSLSRLKGVMSAGVESAVALARSLGITAGAYEAEAVAAGQATAATEGFSVASKGAILSGGGLAGILAGLTTAAGTAATAIAAIDPSGILLAQVAPNPKSNAEKEDEARARAQKKFVEEGIKGTRKTGESYDWLNKQIDKTRTVIRTTTAELNKTPRSSLISRWFGGDDNGVSKMQDKLWKAKDRLDALKAAMAQYAGESGKVTTETGRTTDKMSALGAVYQDHAGKAATLADAQRNLATAEAAAANASATDTDAKKRLETAIKGVQEAQDRLNSSIYSAIDVDLAAAAAEKTWADAVNTHADAATIQADASDLAKKNIEKVSNALVLQGQPALDATQQSQAYVDELKRLAQASPETAAALQPYIDKLQDAINKGRDINGNPIKPTVDNGQAISALDDIITHLSLIKDKSITVEAKTVIREQNDTLRRFINNDGTPNRDGDPNTGGGRANGGPVLPGTRYLVGERGPELLTMGRIGGSITPNNKLGGSTSVTYRINVTTPAVTAETGRVLVEHIRAYERNSGSRWRAN